MMSTSSSSSFPLALLQKSSLSCYKPTAVVFSSGKQDQTQLIKKMFKFGEVVQLNNKKKMLRLHASSSSVKNLVYEDSDQGIICYKDEAGDIICEGYDEGPRLEQSQTKSTTYNSRDVEIIEILQQRNRSNWNQITNNGGSDSKYICL